MGGGADRRHGAGRAARRGALIPRLPARAHRPGRPGPRVLGVVVSSALFAAMHDRWLVALPRRRRLRPPPSPSRPASPTPSPRMSPPTSSSPSGPSPPATGRRSDAGPMDPVLLADWLVSVSPPGTAAATAPDCGDSRPSRPPRKPSIHARRSLPPRRIPQRSAPAPGGRSHDLGYPLQGSLPADPRRLPAWPAGFLGSISHGAGTCVAQVGPARRFLGWGSTSKPPTPLVPDLVATIARPDEWPSIMRGGRLRPRRRRALLLCQGGGLQGLLPVDGGLPRLSRCPRRGPVVAPHLYRDPPAPGQAGPRRTPLMAWPFPCRRAKPRDRRLRPSRSGADAVLTCPS